MTKKVAIIGSGNIGTDLLIKVLRLSETLEIAALAGIDPDSDGLARARRLKVATTHEGVEGLVKLDEFADVDIVFDATSAGAHRHHEEVLRPLGRTLVDLTPAALGPMTPAAPGDAFEARISDLGSVRVRFAKDTAEEATHTTEGTGK